MIEDVTPSLRVLPLGGCGEVGLNATLLLLGQDALLIDCGALLGTEAKFGVNKAVPGFEPLFRDGRRLHGVVLTHGHEDHIGGLPALLAERDAVVVGTPLTLRLARSRLERESGVAPEARRQAQGRLIEVKLGHRAKLGPFSVELIRVTHSVPDSAAVLVECAAGRVLHTGDFKLDPNPHDARPTDVERLRAVGDAGVDLLLSDSTNAEAPGHCRSEAEVSEALSRIVGDTEGRVVVSLFASHFHRLAALAEASIRHGRRISLVGRALTRNWQLGVEMGLLPRDPNLIVRPEALAQMPRGHAVVLASGTQGELRGGLARIANGKDAVLRCLPGDRVVLSSRTIPGNELAVRKILNAFSRGGIEVVHHRMAPVHCSGHAHQDEQRQMLEIVRPKNFVPVHGERTMLDAHARLARSGGIADSALRVIENGASVVLTAGVLASGPTEPVSARPVDGAGRVFDWGDVRERSRLARAGLVVCSVVLDGARRDLVAPPALSTRGVRLSLPPLVGAVAEAVAENRRARGGALERKLSKALSRAITDQVSENPEIEIQIVERENGRLVEV